MKHVLSAKTPSTPFNVLDSHDPTLLLAWTSHLGTKVGMVTYSGNLQVRELALVWEAPAQAHCGTCFPNLEYDSPATLGIELNWLPLQ